MAEGSDGGVKRAPTQGVPGWHDDPHKQAAERLWDGSKWTSEVRGELPKDEPASTAASGTGSGTNQYKSGGAVRGWIRSRPILWVSLAALAAFIVGIGASATENSAQEDQIAEQQDQIASLERQVDRAKAAEDDLASEASDLKEQRQAIEKREQKVSQEEQIQKKSTIADGIWKADADFVPGTYRSNVGDCYWAKLSSADGEFNSIIANGSGPNQTVTIDSPWFESSGCGKWEKIE